MKTTIVDYGMGNIWSVKNALEHIGASVVISSDPDFICKSDSLILPGVGAFGGAIQSIKKRGLLEALNQAAFDKGIGILGICLGMQLFANSSNESSEDVTGFGWIPGQVGPLSASKRLPHIGFNSVYPESEFSPIFENIEPGADFYFVHGFHFSVEDNRNLLSSTTYSQNFASAVQKDNIVGVQFHPEKSQSNGLQLLSNFLKFCRAC